jgi:hypothetical protein
MVSRGIAVPYAHERFDGHRLALTQALAAGPAADVEGLRMLACDARRDSLLAPV